MAQKRFKEGDRVRMSGVREGARDGTVTAVGNYVHVSFDDGERTEAFLPDALELVIVPTRCACGSTSWGGGTDADPQPWCNACGAPQPGWEPTTGRDEIELAARNYLRCLDERQTMTGAMNRLRAALAPRTAPSTEAPPERWGVGSRANDDPFDTAKVGNTKVGLIFGEHPHHRRDNNIYARFANGEIVPFDGHRIEIEVRLKTSNYVKRSGLSGDEVRKACSAQILLNGHATYTVGGRDPERVLYKIPSILERLGEFPVPLWDQKERQAMLGRPVFYDHVPCRIERVSWEDGHVILASEPGFVFPRYDEEDELQTVIKADLLSDHIRWYRTVKPDPSAS